MLRFGCGWSIFWLRVVTSWSIAVTVSSSGNQQRLQESTAPGQETVQHTVAPWKHNVSFLHSGSVVLLLHYVFLTFRQSQSSSLLAASSRNAKLRYSLLAPTSYLTDRHERYLTTHLSFCKKTNKNKNKNNSFNIWEVWLLLEDKGFDKIYMILCVCFRSEYFKSTYLPFATLPPRYVNTHTQSNPRE